jgi:hypothetical protein
MGAIRHRHTGHSGRDSRMSPDLRSLRKWLLFHEVTQELTRRTGHPVGWPELLQLALDGQVALCVSLPMIEVHAPGADDRGVTVPGSRPRTIEGLWGLPVEGLARQHLHKLVRDNTGGVNPVMAEIRTGLVVQQGTTRWEIPQRVWPSHAMTGTALAVRREVIDSLVGTSTAHPSDLKNWNTEEGKKRIVRHYLDGLDESGLLKGVEYPTPQGMKDAAPAKKVLVWLVAGYQTATSMKRWISGKTSDKRKAHGPDRSAAAATFKKVLTLSPDEFVKSLKETRRHRR